MDKNKKPTINPINKNDDKDCQDTARLALNHKEIGRNLGRIANVKPFMDKYNWEGINYPSAKDDWEKFDKNNVTIYLNVLYAKKQKMYPRKDISYLRFKT